jgi:hypothetical protein
MQHVSQQDQSTEKDMKMHCAHISNGTQNPRKQHNIMLEKTTSAMIKKKHNLYLFVILLDYVHELTQLSFRPIIIFLQFLMLKVWRNNFYFSEVV